MSISYRFGAPLYRASRAPAFSGDDGDDLAARVVAAIMETAEMRWVEHAMEQDAIHAGEDLTNAHEVDGPARHCRDGQYQRVADWYQNQDDEAAEDAIAGAAAEGYRRRLQTAAGRPRVGTIQPDGMVHEFGRVRPPRMRYEEHRSSEPIKHQHATSFYDGHDTARQDTNREHEGYGEVGIDHPLRHARRDFYEPEELWDEAGGGRETSSFQHVEGQSTRPAEERGFDPESQVTVAQYARGHTKLAADLAVERSLRPGNERSYESHLADISRELARKQPRALPAPARRKRRYCKSSASPGIRAQYVPATYGLNSYADAVAVGAAAAKAGCSFEHALSVLAGQ
jgi:hypothetical protein